MPVRFPHTLALGAPALLAFASATPLAAQTSAEPLRVMSFNIRYGTAQDGDDAWPRRRAFVADVVNAFDPAVLGLQEALEFQVEAIAASRPAHRVVGVGRDDGISAGEWSAVLVDTTRLEILEEGTFWFSDTPSTPGSTSWGNRIPRICTWAHLRDRATGATFSVYNVHWDHESQPSRERSAGLLLERIRGRPDPSAPALVMGDFNAGETNPAFLALVAPGTRLRDTFRALHPDATGVGTFNAFEGRRGGEKIDAVLASPEWCVLEAAIVRTSRAGRYPSDHFPVTAVLSLSPTAPPGGTCG